MRILANRLDRGFFKYQDEYEKRALEILRSGWYVLGSHVKAFEEEFAAYMGVKHCVGVASGLDALWIAFRLLGIGAGDEVIVQANTYIASVMGITINGAVPIFVEPNACFGISMHKIEEKITERTKAILVVHLYGIPTEMDKIVEICKKYRLKLVEDCAQSHGAAYKGRMTGTFGDIGCFSFYPSKNLGGFGEGGAVIVNDDELAEAFRVFRNYGSEKRYYNKVVGTNSRLDELQAGLLRVRLSHLSEINDERNKIADYYNSHIDNPQIICPQYPLDAYCVWHQYVIRCRERDRLKEYLNSKGIETIIHYPIPPHLSEAYKYLGYQTGDFPITEEYANTVLSIPMYGELTDEEMQVVVRVINEF